MASLLDRLQQLQPNIAPSKQEGIEKVLATKATGRAIPAAGPKGSRVAEQAAGAQARTGIKEITLAQRLQEAKLQGQESAQIAGQKLAEEQLASQGRQKEQALAAQARGIREGITAQEEAARARRVSETGRATQKINNAAEQAMNDLATANRITKDDIFSAFRISNMDLAGREDAARLEQLAHTLSLQDQAYVDELKRVGEARALANAINFENETQRLIFGNDTKRLMDEMQFQAGENVKSRDMLKQLASMGADAKISLAKAATRDAALRSILSGTAGLGSAALQSTTTTNRSAVM